MTTIVYPNSDDAILKKSLIQDNSYDDETDSEVEEIIAKDRPKKISTKGASTPIEDVPNVYGCRIIVGWNVDVVHLMVLSQTSQALHVKNFHKAANETDGTLISFCRHTITIPAHTDLALLPEVCDEEVKG
nr:hypothetical protein [Tanacetum cinerariifolium]